MTLQRKRFRHGRFKSFRLRDLMRFCSTVEGGAGLTLAEQEQFYGVLDTWEGTNPGILVGAGHKKKLKEVYHSANVFKNVLRDNVEAALLNAVWRTCTKVQEGDTLVAFFRPVLGVILALLRQSKSLQPLSGGDRPFFTTAMRESSMDGVAFKMNEEAVVREHGQTAFDFGIHGYGDATRISMSGGTRKEWRCDQVSRLCSSTPNHKQDGSAANDKLYARLDGHTAACTATGIRSKFSTRALSGTG